MKRILILAVIAAAVLIGLNAGAPKIAEIALHQTLSQKMDLRPEAVAVNASPGIKAFLGEVDSISVHGERFRIGGLLFDRFDCDLQGVQFAPLHLLLQQQVSVVHAESGELSASMQCEELRNFLLEKIDDLSEATVTVSGDALEIQGTGKLGGIVKTKAAVRGRFGMERKKLMFIPEHLSVEGFGIRYRSSRIGKVEVYDFGEFPLGIVPDSVTFDGDRLTIHGTAGNS